MTSLILKLPVYKIFLDQILKADKFFSEKVHVNQWQITFNCKPCIAEKLNDALSSTKVIVSNVWVQGKILYIDEDVLVIDDETGLALVDGLSRLPQPSKNFEINCYVIVVGHVYKAGPFSKFSATSYNLHSTAIICASIRAMKVTNISNNANCSKGEWWRKEVLHAQSNVVLSLHNIGR